MAETRIINEKGQDVKETVKPKATVAQKKKTSQFTYGIILFAFMIGAGVYLTNYSSKHIIIWGLGIFAGFVLQRANFGFTAALRDPAMIGSTVLLKAVIIAIAVATVGFAYLQYSAVSQGLPLPGKVSPVGFHVAIGGFVFGIGMVLAGGCASGSLTKIGDGFLTSIVVLIFFIVGSLLGVRNYDWWESTFMPEKGIFLPDVFGWIPALLLQFGMLLLAYLVANWYGNKNSRGL
ncbi:hypothetical protein SAMN00017405_0219 [Desulfonispora thiosulfatigenes DSM 11270]|uniref:Uncharacterized protein n=1 Tax=Desulfonispora thiosulfatigenes DSM 11270 TaxID=656914 RepID=A0A1W1VMB9_DESTI|nr:YeeE/YedE thiosulfate transporter family protein [Desulfonispora thiosulfatigenes]SMB94497.1 hypothetical protein SAMN00017405_0219 [Desulfonispora thiosulfatigenes DSM 11270]